MVKRKSLIHRQKKLVKYLESIGYSQESLAKIHQKIFLVSGIIVLTFSLLYFLLFNQKYEGSYLVGIIVLIWSFGFAIVFFLAEAGFHFYADMKLFWRKKEIERVLPEFLLLASSNMRAGMLIDRALMYAARPKFGALAQEIEIMLKDVMAGKELTDALREFTKKYDSALISRSMGLIIEGIESGGKIATILNKISLNLSEIALQKKEMSASVTTYVIFISFAAVVAAPVLLALAGQMLGVIKGLIGTLANSGVGNTGMMSFMSFTVPTLTDTDFLIFSSVMLAVTSLFSAMIVAVIRKGEVKQGLKYIPLFIIISVIIFFISRTIMGKFLGGLFFG